LDRNEIKIKGFYYFKQFMTFVFNTHKLGNKDILILSSPRSGSTWLMDILYGEEGMKYINEPLSKTILDYMKYMDIETRWNYLTLTEEEKELFNKYFSTDIPIGYFAPINIFKEDFNFKTNRRVIKLIRANGLINWFKTNLDIEIIYLIRHPIPQALSCISRGHEYAIEEYLNNERFAQKYLDGNKRDFVNEILNSGTKREQFVLEWCLDNLVPLDYIENHSNVLVVPYEKLVLQPEETLTGLSKNLNLSDLEKMLSKVDKPSKTTDSSSDKTKEKIKKGDSSFLIEKWKNEVSLEEEEELFEILEKFEIDAYQFDNFLPNEKIMGYIDKYY